MKDHDTDELDEYGWPLHYDEAMYERRIEQAIMNFNVKQEQESSNPNV